MRARPLVSALLLAAAAWGCSKGSRPHVDTLVVETFEGGDVLGLDAAQARARLAASLEARRFVLLGEGDTPPEGVRPWRVTLALGVEEPDPTKGARGAVTVLLELARRGKAGPEGFEVRADERREARANAVADLQDAAREAFEAALGRAAAEARALVELSEASDAELVKALSADEDRRRAAVRLLAGRRNPAAYEPLVARLKTDDPHQLRRTMGLLIQLKDPRAAGALIEASRARDNVLQREIVFALAAIGGDEAKAYLYTVAQGHDDALVRASAQQALDELEPKDGGTR